MLRPAHGLSYTTIHYNQRAILRRPFYPSWLSSLLDCHGTLVLVTLCFATCNGDLTHNNHQQPLHLAEKPSRLSEY